MVRFLLCLFTLFTFSALVAQNKPNVIVILADDMGFSDLSSYGGEIMTPNLDELAQGGIRFRRFYNTTKCSPSRASLLTGQYPHEAGMENLSNAGSGGNSPAFLGYLPNNVVTMAEVFKSNGYKTYMSGKWHVGEEDGHWPKDRGFDRFWGLISGASSYYEIITPEENPNQRSERKIVLDDQIWDPDDTSNPLNPYAPGEFYMTDATSDFAIDFLQDHFQTQSNNPFFLYLSYTAPHWPLHAFESDIDKYDGVYSQGFDHIRETRFNRMKSLGLIDADAELSPRDHNTKWENLNATSRADYERRMQVYAAMLDRMDQNIGRVTQMLKAQGKFDNTIILFLSDNGGSREDVSGRKLNDPTKDIGERGSYVAYLRPWSNVSNVPFRQHKNDTYEGGITTPFIIHHPASISGNNAMTDQIAHIKDVMPTLLEMTNTNYPVSYNGSSIKSMSGKSFKHALDDIEDVKQQEIFFEYSGHRAVRHGKWKTVSESTNGQWFLFNLEEDPTELNDLGASYADLVSQLDKRYNLWEISVNHKSGTLPHPNHAPFLVNPLEDQIIKEERFFSYVFDKSTFSDDPNDDLVYEATLASGQKLPDWIKFDDLLRQFSGIPPAGSLVDPINIRLIAIDWAGNRTIDEFKLILDPQNTGGGDNEFTCLFVVDDATQLNNSDAQIEERIEMFNYDITLISDEDVATVAPDDYSIVVISSTVSPAKVGTTFKDTEAGVFTWEVSLFPEMNMTGTTIYQDYGGKGSQNTLIIENAQHPLAAGLAAGEQVVMNKLKVFYFGVPTEQAITIGTLVDRPERKTIFAYETGAQMFDMTAPGRRVGFFTRDEGASDFNNNGWALFDAAVCWTSGECSDPNGISVSFVTPMDMESFPEGSNLTVQVAASDNNGSITNVSLSLNGTLVRDLSNPPYIWSANNDPQLANMSPGLYTLQSTATDDSGNVESTSIEIMIDNTNSGNQEPIVSFAAPQDQDMFEEGEDLYVKVNASDPDGTIQKVMLYFDGVLVRNEMIAPYEWGDTNDNDPALRNLQVGTHTLRAVAMDDGGAASETTITITVSTLSSNELPTVSFITPTDGQHFTEGTNLSVRVNADDEDGTITSVKLCLDGQLVRDDTQAPYEWTNEPLLNDLEPGMYTLQATATDNDNATTQTSIQINIVAAGTNILPEITFVTPQQGDNFPIGTDLFVQINASDPDGSIKRVHLYLNGQLLRREFEAPYEWDGANGDNQLSNLQAGTYLLEAAAIDNEDDYSAATIMITVGNDNQPGNQLPVLSFDTPTDGEVVPVGTDLFVEVNANDPDGTIRKVDLYFDGQFVRTEIAAPYEWGKSTQNDVELENLQAGTHTLRAIATDDDNATTEQVINITVGSSSNAAPTVNFVTPTQGATIGAMTSFPVEVSASDSDGSIVGVDLYLNGSFISTDNASPYQWSIQNLQAGTHSLRAVARDNQGASGEQTIQISVVSDNAVPNISFVSPMNNESFTAGTNLYVKVNASDSDGTISGVDLYLDGQFVRTETSTPYEWGNGEFADNELKNLSSGTHTIRVVATDDEGATAESSIQIEVLSASGNALPVVTFITPENGDSFPVGTDLYVHVDAYDPDGSISRVRLHLNGQIVRKETFAPYEWGDPEQNNDVLLQNLAAGAYELVATAFDNEGERSSTSIIIQVGSENNAFSHQSNDNTRENAGLEMAKTTTTNSNESGSNDTIDSVLESRSKVVVEENLSFMLSLYPNPVSQELFVDFSGMENEELEFSFYNALGQVVRNYNSSNKDAIHLKWNVAALPTGLYTLEIRSKKGIIKAEKIVISRKD